MKKYVVISVVQIVIFFAQIFAEFSEFEMVKLYYSNKNQKRLAIFY